MANVLLFWPSDDAILAGGITCQTCALRGELIRIDGPRGAVGVVVSGVATDERGTVVGSIKPAASLGGIAIHRLNPRLCVALETDLVGESPRVYVFYYSRAAVQGIVAGWALGADAAEPCELAQRTLTGHLGQLRPATATVRVVRAALTAVAASQSSVDSLVEPTSKNADSLAKFWRTSHFVRHVSTLAAGVRAASLHQKRVPNIAARWAFDAALGVAVGLVLLRYERTLAALVPRLLYDEGVVRLRALVQWLGQNPAGLKLNSEMVQFLSQFFQTIMSLLQQTVELAQPWVPGATRCSSVILIRAGAVIGAVGGLSTLLAAAADATAVATLHVRLFFTLARRIYTWNLLSLRRLLRLFSGKRYNVLRARVDSCEYSVDQLVVGTMFFSVVAFLLPTTAAFHVLFAGYMIASVSLQGGAVAAADCLGSLPVWPLWLRLVAPSRLPCRLELVPLPSAALPAAPAAQFEICADPPSLGAILFGSLLPSPSRSLFEWLGRTFTCVLTGAPIRLDGTTVG